MATPDHTPLGRGYQSSLHYFEHMNDYYTARALQTRCTGTYDLWDTDRPSSAMRNGTKYEELLFRDRMLEIVVAHDMDAGPLLLFYAPHVAHLPLQSPPEYLERFIPLTNLWN